MRNLATHIIARAQNNSNGITNLQLQKILYFTVVNGLKKDLIDSQWLTDQYDENFLVWRYGPVIESIYENYSIFGASKIFLPQSEREEYTSLNSIIDPLLNENVFDLVNASHQHKKWKSNEDKIVYGRSDITYTMEDLLDAARTA
ncbi:Panacea domain-containing protein [Enterococcus sp. AZ109]|uniref:Panacea domain-containing protein n=1 Tax=Enterococcus sp. AZ109 TaxID=2774634 RepID=UPI003F682DE9